jgi:hypothetical protein
MTYSKPEVVVLGNSAEVIQMQLKPNSTGAEGPPSYTAYVPAYDLDE